MMESTLLLATAFACERAKEVGGEHPPTRGLHVTLRADNDFYSQSSQVGETGVLSRLGAPWWTEV